MSGYISLITDTLTDYRPLPWEAYRKHFVNKMYSVSQKNPPKGLLTFPNGCKFLVQILKAYYAFLSTLDYNFLFNYLQLSYAILSATTHRAFQPIVDILTFWAYGVNWVVTLNMA